jgi:hypothetical protein
MRLVAAFGWSPVFFVAFYVGLVAADDRQCDVISLRICPEITFRFSCVRIRKAGKQEDRKICESGFLLSCLPYDLWLRISRSPFSGSYFATNPKERSPEFWGIPRPEITLAEQQ